MLQHRSLKHASKSFFFFINGSDLNYANTVLGAQRGKKRENYIHDETNGQSLQFFANFDTSDETIQWNMKCVLK